MAMKNIKSNWQNMTGKQKKFFIITGSIAIGVLILIFVNKFYNNKKKINLNMTKLEHTQVLQSAKKNLALEDLIARLDATNKRIDQVVINQQKGKNSNPQLDLDINNPQLVTLDDVQRMINENNANKVNNTLPTDTSQIDIVKSNAPTSSPDQVNQINPIVESNQTPVPGQIPVPMQMPDPNQINQMPGTDFPPLDHPSAPPAEKKDQYKSISSNNKSNPTASEEQGTYIPAGAIFSFISLSGINAPTNVAGMKNPMPILLRIKGEVIMPNGYTSDLADCVVIASGYGQMADERVMLRTERMSCIRSDDKVIEAKIEGTIYGEEGKPGIQGKLVSKTGEVISQMIKIGALNTLGQMSVALAGNININKHVGKKSNGPTINIGGSGNNGADKAVITTAAQGINEIFGKIANIYEQYAMQVFPVIEVNPARTGEIIITQGFSLSFEKKDK